jgi:hypothetical protein
MSDTTLSGLQRIVMEAERLREPAPRGFPDAKRVDRTDAILDLIIRLAREVDDVLRIATRD